MCVGGGGGGSSGPSKNTQQDPDSGPQAGVPGGGWSEGYLGGSGSSGSGKNKGSYWKSNPTWDQQWYDKGYKKGDWVSTRENQSDRTS